MCEIVFSTNYENYHYCTIEQSENIMRTYVIDIRKNIQKYQNQKIELKGWVYLVRSSGKIKFLILRDGTGFCQCTFVKANLDAKTWDACSQLTQESTIRVFGAVKRGQKVTWRL